MDGIKILRNMAAEDPGSTAAPEDLDTPFYGRLTVQELFNLSPVWRESRDSYRPQAEYTEMLKAISPAKAWVFFGIWYPDCSISVPRFFKIIEVAGIEDRLDISICAVDRLKCLPADLVARYGIKFVPTFIFERDGREIGRVVETPSSLYLEEDLWNILKPPSNR